MSKFKINVSGGFTKDSIPEERQKELAAELGRQVIAQGHTLISACLNDFDRHVAEAANEEAEKLGLDPEAVIKSYLLQGFEPTHNFGDVRQSQLNSWELVNEDLVFPEPVSRSDAIILIGGHEGTMRTRNWAAFARKPILPIVRCGGSAKAIYFNIARGIADDAVYTPESRVRFEDLANINAAAGTFCPRIIELAELSVSPSFAFGILHFDGSEDSKDTRGAYRNACGRFEPEYGVVFMDEVPDPGRITEAMLIKIRDCAFCLADVTAPRPSVYFEIGYAMALGKHVIITAKEGTEIPFDIKDYPVEFYSGVDSLTEKVAAKISAIAPTQGRRDKRRG